MAISSQDIIHISKLRDGARDLLTPYYDTDFNLLRWLQASDYNYDETLEKLRHHLTYRRSSWQFDSILQAHQAHPINKFFYQTLVETTNNESNLILCIEKSGTIDYWGLLQTYPLNELLKALLYNYELQLGKIMEREHRTGKQAWIVFVMDLAELKTNAQLIEMLQNIYPLIIGFGYENYVELMHCFCVINAPTFISTLWSIVSSFLPPKTRDKVKFFGTNWRKEILDGTDTNMSILLNNIKPVRSWTFYLSIPCCLPCPLENYYSGELLNDSDEVLWVSPGNIGYIDIRGEKLTWVYETDGHFLTTLYFSKCSTETNVENMKAIYPISQRIPGPTYVPMQETLVCKHSGLYKFMFSNEHAWLHTLKIRYKIQLIDC